MLSHPHRRGSPVSPVCQMCRQAIPSATSPPSKGSVMKDMLPTSTMPSDMLKARTITCLSLHHILSWGSSATLMSHADLSALLRATSFLLMSLPPPDVGQDGVLLCQPLLPMTPPSGQTVTTGDLIKQTSTSLYLAKPFPMHLNGVIRNHAVPKMTVSWGNLPDCTLCYLCCLSVSSTKKRRQALADCWTGCRWIPPC